MNCNTARRTMAGAKLTAEVERHLEGCDGCRDFAARLDAVRCGLREHHAHATPDPLFATRVRSRLRQDAPVEVLGWAAIRLLPVSLVVALLLAWAAWERSAVPVEPVAVPVAEVITDPLEWLFETPGDSP